MSQTITNTGALDGNEDALFFLVALDDAIADGGDVVTAVGLAKHKEGERLILGIELEKLLEHDVDVMSCLFGRVDKVVVSRGIGEADAGRLVDEEEVGVGVPAVRIDGKREVFVDTIGSILLKEAEHRRASRTSIHPQHEGSVSGVGRVPRLKEPVEDVFTCVVTVVSIQRSRG